MVIKINVVGYFGALWALSDNGVFTIDIISTSSQFINQLVHNRRLPCLLTILYANLKDRVCEWLWITLKEINLVHNLPSLATRDFNEISCKFDKVGKVVHNVPLLKGINCWISEYGMINLGVVGLKFT